MGGRRRSTAGLDGERAVEIRGTLRRDDLTTGREATIKRGMSQNSENTDDRPVVRVKPSTYQPTRAELREDVSIDVTPEELARAVLRPVKVVRDPEA